IAGRDLLEAQRDEMAALIRIAAQLRAILATHVALQFVDWRRLRPPDDVECDRLTRIATEAADFEIAIARFQSVADSRRWLRGTLVAQHALVPPRRRRADRLPSARPRLALQRRVSSYFRTNVTS